MNGLELRRRAIMGQQPQIDLSNPLIMQAIVARGKARQYYHIGDIITIPWTDYTPNTPVTYQYPFVVAHIGDCYDEEDVKHEDAVYLMARYAATQNMPFDAPESTAVDLATEPNALADWYYWGVTGSTYTALNLAVGDAIPATYDSVKKCGINNLSILQYGYNRWKDSAVRQWLNSGNGKNSNWWVSQHLGDVAPSTTYTNKPGWLYGFGADWISVFKKVKVQTACNTVTDGGVTDITYDKFFLPSVEQMYGSPQAPGVEGEYWEWWKEETGLTSPSNGRSSAPNDARKIPAVNNPAGVPVYVRLRSAYRGYSILSWIVSSGGYLSDDNAANASLRALPACVIY